MSDVTGSTAGVVLVTAKKVFVAGVGDVRGFLVKDTKCIPLFENHKPDSLD